MVSSQDVLRVRSDHLRASVSTIAAVEAKHGLQGKSECSMSVKKPLLRDVDFFYVHTR